MIYVDLSLKEIKEKLVAYGLTKTSSRRFIRYEGNYKDSCIKYGVEISKYHNIYELCCYAYDCYNFNKVLDDFSNDLAKLFSDNLIANE